MQTTELSLFTSIENVVNPELNNNNKLVSQRLENPIQSQVKTLENTLNNIFPEHKEETKLEKARKILGESVKDVSDEDLQTFVTELQYLVSSWFDRYEKNVFGGITLREVLREG